MFHNSAYWLSSRVAGGHMRHLTGTCKRGRGFVHLRSIMGSRGKFKKFMKTHGIRDGTPTVHNQTRKGLGIKLGYGGLFGARQTRKGHKVSSPEELEQRLFGHPHITNTYCGHLDQHPDLASVVRGSPVHLTLVIALPKFFFNVDFKPRESNNGTSPVLPKSWRASIGPLEELIENKLGAAYYDATGSAEFVLATSKASVGLRRSAINNSENESDTTGKYEISYSTSPVAATDEGNRERAVKTVCAPDAHSALMVAMAALLESHTAAARATSHRVTAVVGNASNTHCEPSNAKPAANKSSATSAAKVGPPTALSDRKRGALFPSPMKSALTKDQPRPNKHHSNATRSTKFEFGGITGTHSEPMTIHVGAGKGIFSIIKALKDGADVFPAVSSTSNRSRSRLMPSLAVSTCLRVEPEWSEALSATSLGGHGNGEGKAATLTSTERKKFKALKYFPLDKSTRQALTVSFMAAASRYGLTENEQIAREYRSATATAASAGKAGNSKVESTVSDGSSTLSPSQDSHSHRHHHGEFSAVRSASLKASSVQSLGARRTGFVTLASSLPIATLCQWSYWNADGRSPLSSQQVIVPIAGAGGSTLSFDTRGLGEDLAYFGDSASTLVSGRGISNYDSNRQHQIATLVKYGGDTPRSSSVACGRTWQAPKTREAPELTKSVMDERTVGRSPRSEDSTARPLSVVMLVRCFVPQRVPQSAAVVVGVDNHSNSEESHSFGEDADEMATTRHGSLASSSSSHSSLHINKAVMQSEWHLSEMLAAFSSSSSSTLSRSKSGSGRGSRISNDDNSTDDDLYGLSSSAAMQRSFSVGDVLVGSPVVDSLLLGGGHTSYVKRGRGVAKADLKGQSESDLQSDDTKKSDGKEKPLVEDYSSTPTSGKRLRQRGHRHRLYAARTRGGDAVLAPTTATAEPSPSSSSACSSSLTAPLSLISHQKPSTHASAPNCPLVSYINDEVHNPTTAFLRKTLGVRPVLEDAFAAVDSIKVWHRAIHRSGERRIWGNSSSSARPTEEMNHLSAVGGCFSHVGGDSDADGPRAGSVAM